MDESQRWEAVCITLNKIERTRSRLEKQALLRTCQAQKELKLLLGLALDYHNLYGLTLDESRATDYEPFFPTFISLLERCMTHDIRAREELRNLVLEHPCKWFFRVTNHDLRCGLGIKTINSTFPNLLPEFSPQLAEPFDGRVTLRDTVWLVEPKFDGIRGLITQFDKIHASALSRNGKELYNVDIVCKFIENLYAACPFIKHHVLDGEFTQGDWNQTASTLHTQSELTGAHLLKFQVFDIIPLATFPYSKEPLYKRKELLKLIKEYVTDESPIQIVDGVPVRTLDEAWSIAERLHQSGYEGAIAKDLSCDYKPIRTDNWTKLKFYHTADARITGALEGTGRLAGNLGALQVRFGNASSAVGSGLTDDMRTRLWTMHSEGKLVGKICEITFQEQTADNSLRFPIFLRLREDK